MMMSLRDLERRVKRHPVKKICKLAQTAADTAYDFASRKLHPVDITALRGRFANTSPERKCLARSYQHTVDRRACKSQIMDLVLLELRIGITEASSQK